MDSKFQFSLRGRCFGIDTHLKGNKSTGWEYEQSFLSRFFDIKKAKLDIGLLNKNFKKLSNNFPYEVRVLIIEANELILLSNKSVDVIPYSLNDAEFNKQKTSNAKRLKDIVVANNYQEALINTEVLSILLNKISDFLNFDGLLVLSGELVWSGWLDFFVLIQNILNIKSTPGYLALDSYAVWEYVLLNISSQKEILNFSKSLFLPDITVINNYSQKRLPVGPIEIIDNDEVKTIHNVGGDYTLFDLKKSGYELENTGEFLSRFLLVKNRNISKIFERNYLKKQQLFQSSCDKKFIYRYAHTKPNKVKEGDVNLYCRYPLMSIVKQDTDGYSHVTQIKHKLPKYDYIEMPVNKELLVNEGQLVVKGDVLFRHTVGSKNKIEVAGNSGKISLSMLDKGLLSIEYDEKIITTPIELQGKFQSKVSERNIMIKNKYISIPIDNISEIIGGGILSEWSNSIEQELQSSSFKYIIFLTKQNKVDYSKLAFKNGSILAVIAFNAGVIDKKDREYLAELGINCLFLDIASYNSNPDYERLIRLCLNSYIEIRVNEIVLPIESVGNINSIVTSTNALTNLKKGSFVKFLNYQSDFLYGKIEKSSNDAQGDFLVNMPDMILRAHPANIIIV